MKFEDAVIVRLADPAARAGLFDQDGLGAVAAAGYDHPELDGPYTAVFDTVDFGFHLAPIVQINGMVNLVGDSTRYEIAAAVDGFADSAPPGLTALWRGSVVAHYRPAGSPVSVTESDWSSEQDGRTATLQMTMPDPTATALVPRALPVTVAVLARDIDTASPGALLADTAVIRERLITGGVEPRSTPELRRRNAIVVAWVLPEALFDDADWPGGVGGTPAADRAARRATAATWLSPQGIALTTVQI